jgi:hypothetical protein
MEVRDVSTKGRKQKNLDVLPDWDGDATLVQHATAKLGIGLVSMQAFVIRSNRQEMQRSLEGTAKSRTHQRQASLVTLRAFPDAAGLQLIVLRLGRSNDVKSPQLTTKYGQTVLLSNCNMIYDDDDDSDIYIHTAATASAYSYGSGGTPCGDSTSVAGVSIYSSRFTGRWPS